jgi:hypothetical protein
MTALLDIRPYAGWTGAFTRQQAEGAIPNGTRVEKVKSEAGDGSPLGTKGTVLGSISHETINGIGYFIEWDTAPRCAVFTINWKISPA